MVLFLLPAILFPFYYTGVGALVTEVAEVRKDLYCFHISCFVT